MIMSMLMFPFILPIGFYTCDLTKLLINSNSIAISLSFVCLLICYSWSTHWFFIYLFIFFTFHGRQLLSSNCLLLFDSKFFVFWNIFSFFSFTRFEQTLLSHHLFQSYSLKLSLELVRNFNRIFLINGMIMNNRSRNRCLNLKFSIQFRETLALWSIVCEFIFRMVMSNSWILFLLFWRQINFSFSSWNLVS